MPHKVCFLSGYFNRFDLESKSQGGSEFQNHLLKNLLERKGFRVCYISIGDRKEIYQDSDTTVYYIAKKKFTRRLGDNFFLYIPQVFALLKKIDPDFIYFRGGTSWAGIGAYYANKFGKKFIWALASDEDVLPLKHLNPASVLFNSIDRLIADWGKRRSNNIITQTNYQKDLLIQNYRLKASSVIRNYQPVPTEDLDKPISKVNIVWIGNYSLNKNPELFIEIARQFQADKTCDFVMAGRPFKQELQKKIISLISQQSNIKYLGNISQEEVNYQLSKAHILVNTSQIEGFPNVFIQAMLRKVVVISLNANPDSILTTYNCGYCANGSLSNMISFIRRIVRDPELLNEMAINAHEYSMKNHIIDNCENTLVELFSVPNIEFIQLFNE